MLALEEPRVDRAPRAESTLDELIVGTWEGLVAGRVVACPGCGSPMRSRGGGTADAVEGACERCGCVLS